LLEVCHGKNTTKTNPESPDAVGRSWRIVNDTVMGGASQGRLVELPESIVVFSGRVSLENGGGFASAHVELEGGDLTGRVGVEIEVKGDGKRYQLHLRTTPGPGGVSHRTRFQTQGGAKTTVRLPFSDFVPTFRGRELPEEVRLDPARVRQFGFLIADGQEGEFHLEIVRVSAY
jgi:NADH dehydrogenase [ubiquinone] 1 alpha subcomplex assembly factor 1